MIQLALLLALLGLILLVQATNHAEPELPAPDLPPLPPSLRYYLFTEQCYQTLFVQGDFLNIDCLKRVRIHSCRLSSNSWATASSWEAPSSKCLKSSRSSIKNQPSDYPMPVSSWRYSLTDAGLHSTLRSGLQCLPRKPFQCLRRDAIHRDPVRHHPFPLHLLRRGK